jgi:DNA (cytosine-5)-methyltransferase 1
VTHKQCFAVDLFCGAGGTSTGLLRAARDLGMDLHLTAINHWEIAVASHSANHPAVDHLCAEVDSITPAKVIHGRRVRLLVASPECTHHSKARNGRPIDDQKRIPAMAILRWAEALYIEDILIENVPEFQDWGPVNAEGKPIKRLKGETYQAFLAMLRSLGYKVEDRVLCCANYGDATTRERLFIMARRKPGKKIVWPEPTHTRDGQPTLWGKVEPWRAAREIIDWSLPSESIFNRKRPLVPNTLRRIFRGMALFNGLEFVLPPEGVHRGNQSRSVEDALYTILASRGGGHLVQPFLVKLRGTSTVASVDDPTPGLTAGGNNLWLCEPFVLNLKATSGNYPRARTADEPVPAITTINTLGLVEPYLVHTTHMTDEEKDDERRLYSLDRPMPTQTTRQELALATPYLVEYHGGKGSDGRVNSVDDPLKTQDTSNRHGLVQAFLVKYNGTGGPQSVDDPLDTLTTNDRYALIIPGVTPDGYALDIRYRMLQEHELAAAHSFPQGYKFEGDKKARVKQIGNAVPVRTAYALCFALLST